MARKLSSQDFMRIKVLQKDGKSIRETAESVRFSSTTVKHARSVGNYQQYRQRYCWPKRRGCNVRHAVPNCAPKPSYEKVTEPNAMHKSQKSADKPNDEPRDDTAASVASALVLALDGGSKAKEWARLAKKAILFLLITLVGFVVVEGIVIFVLWRNYVN